CLRCLCRPCLCFFFDDTATTEIYALSLHDALPISVRREAIAAADHGVFRRDDRPVALLEIADPVGEQRQGQRVGPQEHLAAAIRSEEHTSELQSRENLVCRLLLEKKKKQNNKQHAV